MHDDLEKRLDAALQPTEDGSPLPDVVAARVHRCGSVRRAKIAAFSVVPIALAAGLVMTQFNGQPTIGPVGPETSSTDAGRSYYGLGSKQYPDVFSDDRTVRVVQASSERVFTLRDAYNADSVDAILSGT